jgi:glycosyltransferase involved in cell wall biosynthesis
VLVLLPAYNCAPYLGQAIESIQAQTYPNWEMIIIDDASTDDTRAVAERYVAADARLRLITNDRNRYIPYSKNRAVALTSHQYLLMQDADDISLPDRLARSMAFMLAHPDTVLVGGNWILMDPQGDDCYPLTFLPADCLDVRELLARDEYVALHPTWLVRRRAFDAIGGYDEFFLASDDTDFLHRVATRGPIGFLAAPLIRYRGQSGKVSYTRRLRQDAEHAVAFARARAVAAGQPFDLHREFAQRLAEIEQHPGRVVSNEFWGRYNVAKLYLATGKRRRAARELWAALRLWPWRLEPWLGLLLCLLPRRLMRAVMVGREARRHRPEAWLAQLSPELILPAEDSARD